jgi:hypothetical protein
MQSYRAEGYGRLSLLSFLTHYPLYLEIQHLTTYALLPAATTFTLGILAHQVGTRDVTMPLGALKTKLPLRLASLHVCAQQEKYCEFELLPRPE